MHVFWYLIPIHCSDSSIGKTESPPLGGSSFGGPVSGLPGDNLHLDQQAHQQQQTLHHQHSQDQPLHPNHQPSSQSQQNITTRSTPERGLSRSGSQLRRQYSVAAEPSDSNKHVEPCMRNNAPNERTSGSVNAQPHIGTERTEPTGSFNSGGGDNYDSRTHQGTNRVSRPQSRGPQGSSRSGSVNHRDVSSDLGADRDRGGPVAPDRGGALDRGFPGGRDDMAPPRDDTRRPR